MLEAEDLWDLPRYLFPQPWSLLLLGVLAAWRHPASLQATLLVLDCSPELRNLHRPTTSVFTAWSGVRHHRRIIPRDTAHTNGMHRREFMIAGSWLRLLGHASSTAQMLPCRGFEANGVAATFQEALSDGGSQLPAIKAFDRLHHAVRGVAEGPDSSAGSIWRALVATQWRTAAKVLYPDWTPPCNCDPPDLELVPLPTICRTVHNLLHNLLRLLRCSAKQDFRLDFATTSRQGL